MIESQPATELGSPAPATAPVREPRSGARVLGTEFGYAAIAGLLALAVALWSLRIWDANLNVPFRYAVVDDTKFYLMLIKGILDHGWFLTNHSLGAPFGQQLYDYPQGADNLNLFGLKLIGLITPHPGAVINVFLLATFVLDAAAACLVMRRLGVSPATSIVCAVLFAVLPYHWFRSDSHLFLSSYWSLPFTAYLFIAVLDDRPLLARRAAGRLRWCSLTTVATVAMCVVIASTGLYYAVFGLIMIAAAVLLKLLAQRRLAPLLPGVAAFALVLAVLVANLAPTVVYHAGHGGNSAEVHSASQGDSLAMSASYLVLPPLHDRIAPLRHVTEHYANVTPPHGYCEQCYETVGTVGDVGLVWLLVIAFGSLTGAAFVARVARVNRWSAVGVAVVLAIAVTGGISSLTRVFVSNDIRAWNRMSVLIAFFALLAAGLLLDRLLALIRTRLARRDRLARLGAWPGLVVLAAVLAFGIADQTSGFFVPNFSRDAAEYHSDGRFDAAIQRTLPTGAEVMELPYVPYPGGLSAVHVAGADAALLRGHELRVRAGPPLYPVPRAVVELRRDEGAGRELVRTARGQAPGPGGDRRDGGRVRRAHHRCGRLPGRRAAAAGGAAPPAARAGPAQRGPLAAVLRPAAVRATAALDPPRRAADGPARRGAAPAAADVRARPAERRQSGGQPHPSDGDGPRGRRRPDGHDADGGRAPGRGRGGRAAARAADAGAGTDDRLDRGVTECRRAAAPDRAGGDQRCVRPVWRRGRRRSGRGRPSGRSRRLAADGDRRPAVPGGRDQLSREGGRAGAPAAALSACTSAAVRRRDRPVARSPSANGPKAVRCSETTRWPTASHMRFT